MCGIVAGVSTRDVSAVLLEGLRRLEYRGYDSAGMATCIHNKIERVRLCGKVENLAQALKSYPLTGKAGVAHTRWATHGKPSEANAHPHVSGDRVAIVHNGIIENHQQRQAELSKAGYTFVSETDTEVIAHGLHEALKKYDDPLKACQKTLEKLEGAFALAAVFPSFPDTLVVARSGAPLVIGVGIEEYYAASDVLALLPVTQKFIYLEDGDVAVITQSNLTIYNASGEVVERKPQLVQMNSEVSSKGQYRHFMEKEIFEQPMAIAECLEGRLSLDGVLNDAILGQNATAILDKVSKIQIVACGTSYHAGLVAKEWFATLGIGADVDVASEFRYRPPVVQPDTLLLTISQSGETADTLGALKDLGHLYLASLVVCNVPRSALVQLSDLVLLTHAGPEIGVASTKAFSTQLVALSLIAILIGRRFGLSSEVEKQWVDALRKLPEWCDKVLKSHDQINFWAQQIATKNHCLFLGRGVFFPIALEGALKLKEISYIHAEAYPAGELKHGPLALIDEDMPVVALLSESTVFQKMQGSLKEVEARGGQTFVLSDQKNPASDMLSLPHVPAWVQPILYTLPLQLLAYYVAVMKGTDVDQPRNLAKSVTVE